MVQDCLCLYVNSFVFFFWTCNGSKFSWSTNVAFFLFFNFTETTSRTISLWLWPSLSNTWRHHWWATRQFHKEKLKTAKTAAKGKDLIGYTLYITSSNICVMQGLSQSVLMYICVYIYIYVHIKWEKCPEFRSSANKDDLSDGFVKRDTLKGKDGSIQWHWF